MSTSWNRPRRALVLLALPALALPLGACGDDDEAAAHLSRAEFVTQANAICRDASSEIDETIGGLFAEEDPSPEATTAAFGTLIEQARSVVTRVRGLDEPTELSDDVDAWLTAFDDVTDDVEAGGADAFFAGSQDPWLDPNQQAGDLGLDVCAADGSD